MSKKRQNRVELVDINVAIEWWRVFKEARDDYMDDSDPDYMTMEERETLLDRLIELRNRKKKNAPLRRHERGQPLAGPKSGVSSNVKH